jgi:hypothetical protein
MGAVTKEKKQVTIIVTLSCLKKIVPRTQVYLAGVSPMRFSVLILSGGNDIVHQY